MKYGWWWLKNYFKKNPKAEQQLLKLGEEGVEEVVETVEKKAPTVIEDVAAREAASSSAYAGDALATRVRAEIGKVGVNLGGTGEEAGFINLNNLSGSGGQRASSIPNLINGGAENIATYFTPGRVDEIVANNIVPGSFNWMEVAKGCYSVLRNGGTVRFAEFGGGAESGVNIKLALEAAGFKNVSIFSNVLVVGTK
jgi:hypothetical protein